MPKVGGRVRRAIDFKSPESFFCLWIVLGLGLFSLQWSLLFSPMRSDNLFFLSVAFIIFGWRIFAGREDDANSRETPDGPSKSGISAITVYFLAAFGYNQGVPLLQVLRGDPYDIYSFGIPGFHIAFLTLAGFLGLRHFRQYLIDKSRGHLYSFLWLLVLIVSIGSRSALSFFLFSALCLFLQSRKLKIPAILALLALGIGFLAAFGQFGNARLSYQIEQETGQAGSITAIANLSRASENFYDSQLPVWTLWPYMYVASPLANLNSSFEMADGTACGAQCNLEGLVFRQMLPSSIGEPIANLLEVPEIDKRSFLIAPDLTASTTFGSPVAYAGAIGAYAMLFELLLLTVLVSRYLRNSPYRPEGMAILSTILFFSFFENMIAYSALSLQLAWPVAATILFRNRLRATKRVHPKSLAWTPYRRPSATEHQ